MQANWLANTGLLNDLSESTGFGESVWVFFSKAGTPGHVILD